MATKRMLVLVPSYIIVERDTDVAAPLDVAAEEGYLDSALERTLGYNGGAITQNDGLGYNHVARSGPIYDHVRVLEVREVVSGVETVVYDRRKDDPR